MTLFSPLQHNPVRLSTLEPTELSGSVDNSMPLVDDESSEETPFRRLYSFLRRNLNFYRLHILYLCRIPHHLVVTFEADQFG